ncbi:hypothetical protein OS493_020921 [Desmophyllum pertusum]|uniref:Uncharacterized protein n=1 Tax=Desmophyllum pertusum TaxID=174260 RepID=A0A9W9ZZV6_9CNID|nr:hypothetical protein OS493_020921 [Desmophyllum pertusum]
MYVINFSGNIIPPTRHPRNKNQCPAYGTKCLKCGFANNFASKCRTKETRQSKAGKRLHLVEIEDDTEDEFSIGMITHKIGSLNTKSNCKSIVCDDDDTATQDSKYTPSMSKTVIDDNILTEYGDVFRALDASKTLTT